MPPTLSSLPVDQLLIVIAVLVAGLLIGVVVAWLVASRSRAEALEQAALRFEVTRAQLTARAGAADRELADARPARGRVASSRKRARSSSCTAAPRVSPRRSGWSARRRPGSSRRSNARASS
jgi:type II secretory pathway pseudopilin PulG